MEGQTSIIMEILAAILTGGFLMIFIESQRLSGSVAERFHFVMDPFFRSFSNYVKFISSFRSYFEFKVTQDSVYIRELKDKVKEISRLGGMTIMSGRDFPSDYFTAERLDSICNRINHIWYITDRYCDYVDKYVEFDSYKAERYCSKEYLEAISPKYKDMPLTKDVLGKVSGDFFVDIYQPIQNVLYEYELWQKEERCFRDLTLFTIVFTLITMIIILFFNCCLPMWVFNLLCVICCVLLVIGLCKLIEIDRLSNAIMR